MPCADKPRRSNRVPGASSVCSPPVLRLLDKIRSDSDDVNVLKLSHYIGPGANSLVIDAVLEALLTNENCQALYVQNFDSGFRDDQIDKLVDVLKRGNIWCLNAGELYHVSERRWRQFALELGDTNLTHAYISEHHVSAELKKELRDVICRNRQKHTRHKSLSNIGVISRCTNMWWSPVNSRDLRAEMRLKSQN